MGSKDSRSDKPFGTGATLCPQVTAKQVPVNPLVPVPYALGTEPRARRQAPLPTEATPSSGQRPGRTGRLLLGLERVGRTLLGHRPGVTLQGGEVLRVTVTCKSLQDAAVHSADQRGQ